ncbi:hypothetical protein IAU60_003991 [Kwoniella sp. DSM 27419]
MAARPADVDSAGSAKDVTTHSYCIQQMNGLPFTSTVPSNSGHPKSSPDRHGAEAATRGRRQQDKMTDHSQDLRNAQAAAAGYPPTYQGQQFANYGNQPGLNPAVSGYPDPSHPQRFVADPSFQPFNGTHMRQSSHPGFQEAINQRYDYPMQSYMPANANPANPQGMTDGMLSPHGTFYPKPRRDSIKDGEGAFARSANPTEAMYSYMSHQGQQHQPPQQHQQQHQQPQQPPQTQQQQQQQQQTPFHPHQQQQQNQSQSQGQNQGQQMQYNGFQPFQSSTPLSGRSRGSTFGSRTSEDGPIVGLPGTNNNSDESRPNTADREQVTVKDFSEKNPKKMKLEPVDDVVETDQGEAEPDEKMDHRKRKRNRTIRSCVPCHNHKRKCDRKRPCGRCTALGLTGTCVYEIDEQRDLNDPTVAEADRLRRRIAELEQVVRELRQKAPSRAHAPAVQTATPANEIGGEDNKKRRVIVDRFARFKLDEAKDAENSAAAAAGLVKGEPSDAPVWAPHNQPAVPEGQPGGPGPSNAPTSSQMVMGGSMGGTQDYREEPYQAYLLPGEEMTTDKTGRKTFLGALTGKTMLRRLRELAETKGDGELLTVAEDVAFSGVFPDMRKTFPFTTIWSHENFSAEIIGLLPNEEQAALLWEAWEQEYSAYFHPFYMPAYRAEYFRFFAMSNIDKMNTPLASLALFLIQCAIGCLIRTTSAELFGTPDFKHAPPGMSKVRDPKDLTCSRLQSELYLSASFQALRLCAFLATPTIRTMQCQILLIVYLVASERAADAWNYCGTMIKQAIALGLHKDPLSMDSQISMREAEIRRRIWWSLAAFDSMLCIFFGRPSQISYYTTNLPQDRPDDKLSDAPGSAQLLLPPSNVLSNETTEQTYHTAYYQLTIPSFELLDRIFQVDKRYSRSMIYGWFSPLPNDRPLKKEPDEDDNRHTYKDALRLAHDISKWYSHIPSGMKFDKDDSADYLLSSRNRKQLNQTLMLSIKTWTLCMVLHRPYLRIDPSAYPESSEVCSQAAHNMLRTYRAMHETKSSLAWSFWTMPYRAFQAGAVCAFLAIRQPGTELAAKCLDDLRGAIRIFEDRLSTWNQTHPVQADLTEGLVRLEKLVAAATEQATSPRQDSAMAHRPTPASISTRMFGFSPNPYAEHSSGTPLAQIQGFPALPEVAQLQQASYNATTHAPSWGNGTAPMPPQPNNNNNGINAGTFDAFRNDPIFNASGYQGPVSDQILGNMLGDFNGPEPLALPQFWASMFGIKMEQEKEPSAAGVPM